MQETIKKLKNPLERISRRSVLGVMGVGVTGVLIGCNDDLSPLSATLTSDMTDLTTAGSIMLTAKLDVGYANSVEFYDGTTLLDTVPMLAGQASKQITLDATKNGKHTFITKITSSTGKQAYSNPVDVTVNIGFVPLPVAPTISLATSSNSVTVGGSITLTATAAATTGTITKVEFFEGATLLKSVPAAPFIFTTPAFTSTDNGKHTYTAKVTTDASSLNNTTSAAVDVVVNILAPLPAIALTASPATVTAAGNVTLTAAITGGSFTQVEFFEGQTSLGMGVVAGTSYTKTIAFTATSPAQTHNYTAKGTVADGRTVSTTVNVNVNIGNQAPTITLTSSSLSVTVNSNITLTATATAKTGTISSVEFFDGSTSLGVVNAPTAFTKTIAFTAANNGTHNYTAKATDSSGNSATSTPAVAVTVNIPTLAPTVTLTSSSTNVTTASSITLSATPTPASGVTISQVQFFEGTKSLGIVSAAPYNQVLPAFAVADNGSHTYTAVATDSSGKTASATVVVLVNIATAVKPPTVTLSTSSGSVTVAGSVTLSATVTPGTGTITQVEFFEGTTSLGKSTSTTSPYTFAIAYTSANNGAHAYTCKVTASDTGTNLVTSSTVNVTVSIGTTAGTLIALYTALATAGSYVNFTHPTSKIKCILYRAPTAQTGGVSNAGAYYVAYSRKCTHAGTIISNNPNTATPHVLTCQDHGATYNMDSNCAPINGVAPSALPSIVIKVGTDGIYI